MENVPPTPSPPPRLRRSPKRRALHERSDSVQNANPFEDDARDFQHNGGEDSPGHRRFEDKIHAAASPYPTCDAQRLPPPPAQRSIRGRPTARSIFEVLEPPHAGVRVSRPNTRDASGSSSLDLRRRPVNASAPDAEVDDLLPINPRPWPTTPHTASQIVDLELERGSHPTSSSPSSGTSFSSSPPWRLCTPVRRHSWTPSGSLDVEHRSSMDGYSRDEDENLVSGHDPPSIEVSSPMEGDSEASQYASSPSLPRPRAPASRPQHPSPQSIYTTPSSSAMPTGRASLGAIASVAAGPVDRVSREHTPMTSDSVGSSGTVHRQRNFEGPVPEGYFYNFPPSAGGQWSSPPRGRRPERSSSDPARPRLGGMEVSPASSGSSGSPTSPVSPIDEGTPRSQAVYFDPARTASDPALHLQAGSSRTQTRTPYVERDTTGRVAAGSSPGSIGRPASNTLFNQIASQASHAGEVPGLLARPLPTPRTIAPRVVSVMSTIQSEATEEIRDDRSSGAPSFGPHESADYSSQGPEFWGLTEQFPQTPRSPLSPQIPFTPALEEAEEEEETMLAEPDVEPGPEREQHSEPEMRQRRAEGASTSIYDKALPPLPEAPTPDSRAPSVERHSSPPAVFVPAARDPFGMEPARPSIPATPPQQTSPAQQKFDSRGWRGSLKRRSREKRDSGNSFRRFRESLPAWARMYYANEARHRATIGAQPLTPVVDSSKERPKTVATQGVETRPESLRLSRSRERALLQEYRARERAYRVEKVKQPMPRSRYSRVIHQPSPLRVRGLTFEDSTGGAARHSNTPLFPDPVESPAGSIHPEWSDKLEGGSAAETSKSTSSSGMPVGAPETAVLAPIAHGSEVLRPISRTSDYSLPSSYGEGPSQRPFPEQPSQHSQRRSFERPVSYRPDVQASYSDPDFSEQHRAAAYAATQERHSSTFAAAHAAQRRRSEIYGSPRRSQRHASRRSDASRRRSDRLRPISDYSSQRRSRNGARRSVSDQPPPRPISDHPTTAGRMSARVMHRPVPGVPPVAPIPLKGPIDEDEIMPIPPRATYRSSRRPYGPDALFAEEESVMSPVHPSYAEQAYAAPQPRLPRDMDGDWSPHLWHDRRATVMRRRTYIEPSIDGSAEGMVANRRNFQIWLFALGFVMPLTWVVAAFLPLPHQPRTPPPSPSYVRDLEKQIAPDEIALFENARWWRNVNRCMVPVALGIIVAVIVSVVVAARQG